MTYRDKREARAERLREWAEKREARAAGEFERAAQIGDMIPLGQPILMGHHSQRRHTRDLERIDSAMSRGCESAEKARSMTSRAGNIEAALEVSIYDDDPDALERLRERVAALEAERDRIKAYNASCRRGTPDDSLLTAKDRTDLERTARYAAYQLGKGGAFPSYKLANLNGNITRNRQRLARLEAKS